jgi:hypothetical protein
MAGRCNLLIARMYFAKSQNMRELHIPTLPESPSEHALSKSIDPARRRYRLPDFHHAGAYV